ncbi:hypothetical protein EVAR_17166_1 [Eumeta japonica]|uniref:Uncharacterized protein n=1 Tax=Eumeta variegata TaxID=151549 RepID=A0A4C1U8W9_EUMVA|nr:hypothetical protein EVAR_17166_1 [Eumeta japonica]
MSLSPFGLLYLARSCDHDDGWSKVGVTNSGRKGAEATRDWTAGPPISGGRRPAAAGSSAPAPPALGA